MLGTILAAAGLDPTVYLGAAVPDWGDLNFRAGKGSLFVAELAFGPGARLDAAKVGILIASLAAGISGYLLLRVVLPRSTRSG